MPNPHLCHIHQKRGGKTALVDKSKSLPRVYSQVLSPTLREAVERELEKPRSEQVELYQELACLRAIAQNALKLYSAADEKGAEPLKVQAAEMVKDAFAEIRATCSTIAAIEAKSSEVITIHTVHSIIGQMVSLLYKTLEPAGLTEYANVYERRIREEVILPVSENAGTLNAPNIDAEVEAMDMTVPAGG